jgi:hypothetical protein
MLSLVLVNRNAGCKTSPSFIRPGQTIKVELKDQPDEDVIKLCERRDKLNVERRLDLPANRTGLVGRYTVVDERQEEVEL